MESPGEVPTGFDTSIMNEPIGMGRHFMKVFENDEYLSWRMVPFILIWAAFAVVLLVGIYFYYLSYQE